MFSSGDDVVVQTLEAALRGEITAQAKYKAFATQADTDELKGIASLFRAIARSEQIHSNNHSRVIRHMGGDTSVQPKAAQVHETLDNLKVALSGEQLDISSIYPAYIDRVDTHLDTRVVRTLTWALESERSHAQLLERAIALADPNKGRSWIHDSRIFYVCTVCGYTIDIPESDYCPICNYPRERFEVIR